MKAHLQRWARLSALAGVSVMGLLTSTACGTSPPPATPTAAPTTPSPTADPRAGLADMVNAAGLLPKDLGVAKATSEDTVGKLAMPCNTPLAASGVAAHSWVFSDAQPAVVSNSVYAYYPEAGAAVVDQIHPALTACKTWNWAGTWELAVVGEFTVTVPAGADNAVAYCHHGTILTGSTKGDKVYLCDGLISRGHLVAQVGAVKLTLAAAQSEVTKAVALAGAALVRAVPAP